MEIRKGNQMFYVGESEKNNLAKVTFQVDVNGNFIIDHTFVSTELRGQKIAQKLVKQMVEFAREQGKQIIPVCSYAVAEFEKNEDYKDVLYQK